jgi:hypothetical protein
MPRLNVLDKRHSELFRGGYGEDELIRAGAFRAFRDAADLRNCLDELGILL